MADRIVVMNAGRIEQIGAGTEIYRAPATRFVAEFIGEANLIAYEASRHGGIRLAVQDSAAPAPQADVPPRGLAVLRPEHLQVLDDAHPGCDGLCRLSGVLSDVVSVGSHTMIHADIGGHAVVARAMGLPSAGMLPGSPVRLGFHPSHLHLIGEQA